MAESDYAPGDSDWKNKGVFKKFYQEEFLDTNVFEFSGLTQFGYVYYPNQCFDGSTNCKVHMHWHSGLLSVDNVLLNF